MATNLSDLGFGFPHGSEFESLARKCFENGRATRCELGTYIVWSIGHGIELIIQLSPKEELIGLNPHFAGKTIWQAVLSQRISRNGYPLDGGFLATTEPASGSSQFVFDSPDMHVHHELKLPYGGAVQLAGFVQQCTMFDNKAAFIETSQRKGLNLTTDMFLPSGFFDAQRRRLSEPLASAMVCGVVESFAKLVNPVTRKPFFQIQVETIAGPLDLVADSELIPQGIKPAQIIQCSVWLSGRIVSEQTRGQSR